MEQPRMLTIRQTAATGILTERALRTLVKTKRIKVIYVGNRALINYQALVKQLKDATEEVKNGR